MPLMGTCGKAYRYTLPQTQLGPPSFNPSYLFASAYVPSVVNTLSHAAAPTARPGLPLLRTQICYLQYNAFRSNMYTHIQHSHSLARTKHTRACTHSTIRKTSARPAWTSTTYAEIWDLQATRTATHL